MIDDMMQQHNRNWKSFCPLRPQVDEREHIALNHKYRTQRILLRHQLGVCDFNMQDDTMQRSYVQQAASRKHALKLRGYSRNESKVTSGRRRRPNFQSSHNKSETMATSAKHFLPDFTPRSRKYVRFEGDESDRYAPERRFQSNNSIIKGTKTYNSDNIVIRSPIEGGGIGIKHERSHSHHISGQIPDITLTDIGRRFPTLFQPSKIQVVNRMVNVIDLVPPQFRHADTIYLTNNRLANLTNIGQFKNLQTLSLAHNDISSINQLKPLLQCTLLKYLKLEGCPVCDLPFYRLHVIRQFNKIKSLKVLDKDEIFRKEKMAAKYVVEKEGQMYKKMFRNFYTIYKLKRLLFHLKLHLMFRQIRLGEKMPRNIIVPPTISSFPRHDECNEVNIDNYLKFWKFGRYDVDSEFKLYIRSNITKGVCQFWKLLKKADSSKQQSATHFAIKGLESSRLGANSQDLRQATNSHKLWEEAFSQMQMVQDSAINQLVNVCEEYKVKLKEVENLIASKDPQGLIEKLEEEEQQVRMLSPRSSLSNTEGDASRSLIHGSPNHDINNKHVASYGLSEPVPWPAPTPLPIDDKRAQDNTIAESDATHLVDDDPGLEDENAPYTDKGKMYLALLAQSSKKRSKSMSTHSENKFSPSPSHLDSSRTSPANAETVDENRQKFADTVVDDIVISTSTPSNHGWKKNLRQQFQKNAFERREKGKRSQREATQASKKKQHGKTIAKDTRNVSKGIRNASKARSPKEDVSSRTSHSNNVSAKQTRLLAEKLSVMNNEVEKLQHERDEANHKLKEYEILLHHYVKGEDKVRMAIELCETHVVRRVFGAWQKIVLLLRKQRHRAFVEKSKKTLATVELAFRSWQNFTQNEVVSRHKNILATKHKNVNQLSTSFLIWHRKIQDLKQNHRSTRHLIAKANCFIKKKYFVSWTLFVEREQIENENIVKLGYLHILGRRYLRQWKLATSSVELERVTNTLAMKHYINCLQLNAFNTWADFTAHSIEDKKFTVQKQLKTTVLNVAGSLLDQVKQRHQKSLRSRVFNTWHQQTLVSQRQNVSAKALHRNYQRSRLSIFLYKWRLFTVFGKMNVVQESLNAEQLNTAALREEISNLQKQLYNNRKQMEILELQSEREKLIAFKQYEELSDEVMVLNMRTEDKENKARVISQEVKSAKKGVEFLLQKVKLQNREVKFLQEENSLTLARINDLQKRLDSEKAKVKKSNLEKQKLHMQMQLIENSKSEVNQELENQKQECLKLSRRMEKLKNSWQADTDAFSRKSKTYQKNIRSLKSKIKAETKAKLTLEDHLKEKVLRANGSQAAVEKKLNESIAICTKLRRELEEVTSERNLLEREKENTTLLMLHLQKKMEEQGDLQIEDMHLKTKRMNRLEGERFEIESKYEMLLAKDKEREKILQEKNSIIRNLKQGMQLSMISSNTNEDAGNENNKMGKSELMGATSNGYSSSEILESNGQVRDSNDLADDANDVSTKLKQLKKNIEDKLIDL